VTKRLLVAGLLTWVLSALVIGLTPDPSVADAPRNQGWWTVTNPVPAPPDVPANGLLVQAGGGGAPTAFAAVLYELGPDTTAATLTLTVAPNSVTTPSATLEVCPLLQPITHAEQGGPMSDAPPYNCGRQVTAAPTADGKYQFDAARLVTDRVVAVAILPTGPVDRVVLSEPDANSLATRTSQVDADPTAGITTADSLASAADTAPSSDTASGIPSTGASAPLDVGAPGASATGPLSVVPPPAAGDGNTFVPVATASVAKATPLLVLLFVASGLVVAALWLFAGQSGSNGGSSDR
jgi:hypothetical protein